MCFIQKSDGVEDPIIQDTLSCIEALSIAGAEVERHFSDILTQLDQVKKNENERETLVPKSLKCLFMKGKEQIVSPKIRAHRIDKLNLILILKMAD